jgi:hypothetical protein
VVTPGGSEETVVEEHEEVRSDSQKVIDHVAGDELREQDISEQKELIQKLKAQRAAEKKEAIVVEEEAGEEEGVEDEEQEESANGKRVREDEEAPLQFQFSEPQAQETEERQIATNSRVNPGTKRIAWGVAAFAAGLGAVLLPTFF